ncbi:MAG TPA: protease inhibitor I42 family protein, partial [Chloroflexota bacterium]|nr:protease inhibitor I42 family protein [Chloroflexota bacterium]
MPDITLTQADNGAAFEITPGSRVVLQLAESPSTGYVWAVDELDQQVLSVEDSSISLSADTQVGGG